MKKLTNIALGVISVLGISNAAIAASKGIEEVVVTAQRVSENIQDVPIAITALTGDMLDDKQVITVADLQMNAPNVSFTNTNFGSNSFSIRGIGRLLTSSTGDAGVSIHTNEISMFSSLNTSEFFDMERVEILRGPQGTLYGKNATGGVVNFVTRKPDFDSVNGYIDVEVGDYSSRRVKGALNFPITDNFAIRFAGMDLDRDGYTKNLAAGQVGLDGRVLTSGLGGDSLSGDVDGRNQREFRITARWDISDNANLWVMYSDGDEDSNRTRINNQVCVQNDFPTYGCEPDGVGFETPYETAKVSATVAALYGLIPVGADGTGNFNWPRPQTGLRSMHTDFEPVYETNLEQWSFGFDYDFSNFSLGIVGHTGDDGYFTQQDVFMDVGYELPYNFYRADGLWPVSTPVGNAELGDPSNPCNVFQGLAGTDGGICQDFSFTQDFAYDQSSNEAESWSWEIKLQSTFDGPFNFLAGYTAFDRVSKGDYYVLGNLLDGGNPASYPGFFNSFDKHTGGTFLEGHSFFGEVYYDVNDDIKLTFGLRYNDDEKATSSATVLWNAVDVNFPLSSALAGNALPPLFSRLPGFLSGAAPSDTELALINLYAPGADLDAALLTGAQSDERLAISNAIPLAPGYNESRILSGSPEEFDWQETTGRIGIDWQVNDNTMLYAFFSRGYKPGGANPAIPPEFQNTSQFAFEQEDIDAWEIGIKNTLLDGSMILNANIFTYDYTGLQVARIKNNSSINENIDAKINGAELELFWRPQALENLEIDFNYSWLDTEVDGSQSVDPTNRLAGDDSWTLLNGFGVLYIAPTDALLAATPFLLTDGVAAGAVLDAPASIYANGIPSMVAQPILDALGIPHQEGLPTNLDGNQLPNSPEHTIKLGVGYTWPVEALKGEITARWDYYWQDDTYAREFNTRGDLIDSWDQHNASIIYNSTDGKWNARLWARNFQDKDNITGHYLTADTTGYFRNYFTTEPRIYGLSVRYNFGE